MHLSRIAEDLIIWASAEFGYVSLPDAFATGSSMMPQKKNPDSLELVRGKTGRVYGSLMAALTVMKALPMGYGKDMQEDKEPLFDTLVTVEGSLRIMKGVIDGITFNTERMEEAIDKSVLATDLADEFTKRGAPFRKAHETAAKSIKYDKKTRKSSIEIAGDFLSDSEMFDLLDVTKSTDRRSLPGGTGRESVKRQFEQARKRLGNEEA